MAKEKTEYVEYEVTYVIEDGTVHSTLVTDYGGLTEQELGLEAQVNFHDEGVDVGLFSGIEPTIRVYK